VPQVVQGRALRVGQVTEGRRVGRRRFGFGPAGTGEAVAEIGQLGVGDFDPEGLHE
jgi:hypothetical protein